MSYLTPDACMATDGDGDTPSAEHRITALERITGPAAEPPAVVGQRDILRALSPITIADLPAGSPRAGSPSVQQMLLSDAEEIVAVRVLLKQSSLSGLPTEL
jgi:hypothetical protein